MTENHNTKDLSQKDERKQLKDGVSTQSSTEYNQGTAGKKQEKSFK